MEIPGKLRNDWPSGQSPPGSKPKGVSTPTGQGPEWLGGDDGVLGRWAGEKLHGRWGSKEMAKVVRGPGVPKWLSWLGQRPPKSAQCEWPVGGCTCLEACENKIPKDYNARPPQQDCAGASPRPRHHLEREKRRGRVERTPI